MLIRKAAVWVLLSLVSVVCHAAPPDYLNRPGTAAHAVSVPDGTQVTLDSMIADH